MRWFMWIIILTAVPVWALPAMAQALEPKPVEIRIYQDYDATDGYHGLATVSKRFQCPVPECRYSSNVGYSAPGVLATCPNPLGLPSGPGDVHESPIPLVDLANTPKRRFIYSYLLDAVTGALGLTRPFHPGADSDPHEPMTADPGTRVRIRVVGLEAGSYRLRIMPPGVRKPMAMGWVREDDDGADADHLFARPSRPATGDLQTGTAQAGSTTQVTDAANLTQPDGYWVDAWLFGESGANDGESRQVTAFDAPTNTLTVGSAFPNAFGVGDSYRVAFMAWLDTDANGDSDNVILANPATCPTARWTIRCNDRDGTATEDYFTLYRGDPSADSRDGSGSRNDPAVTNPGVRWLSDSEEVSFCFNNTELDNWWPDSPAPGAPLEQPTIAFDTYSNCVYLPYPGLATPGGTDGPDDYFVLGAAGDIEDASATAKSGTAEFFYEPRIGETGVGRIDVLEREGAGKPWRPYDVDRAAAIPPGNSEWVFVQDSLDADGDGSNDDYIDRSLHAFFFCSRQEAGPDTDGDGAPNPVFDPVDGFLPWLNLGSGLPGSTALPNSATPPWQLAVLNRATQEVLRCPNCGAVHPIKDAQHPIAPTGGTVPAPDAVDHSTTGLGEYCEFCGTQLLPKKHTESESADTGLAELTPLRTTTAAFSRTSLGETSGSAEMPFENVLFGPLTLALAGTAVGTVPVDSTVWAGFGIRVPSFQPPSFDAVTATDNPYRGVGLLYETQDERNRWYYEPGSYGANPEVRLQNRQSRTGAGKQTSTTVVTREHLLFDNNGTWDTYYVCPDCGSKQSLLRYDLDNNGDFAGPGEQLGCLNKPDPADPDNKCPGHSFCPVHGAYFASAEAGEACIFWKGTGTAPNYISATGEQTGTAQAGSSDTQVVDAVNLTQPDGYWVGGWLFATSGANDGEYRQVTAFDATTDTLTVAPAFPNAFVVGDSYRVTFWRNVQLDEDSLTAEEYEPVRVQLSVPRVPAVQVAGGPVQLGDVSPGSAAAPHTALNADLYPQETSRSAALPVENVGNVVLDNAQGTGVAIDLTTVGLHPTTGAPIPGDVTRADALGTTVISSAREQQSVPVNTGGQAVLIAGAAGSTVQPVDHAGAAVAAPVFNMVPAYPEELAGSRFAYVPGAPPGPGPGGLRGGNPALAALRPLPNGTPVGEYAGLLTAGIYTPGVGLTIRAGAAPVRLRVVESRLPANSVVAADASPSAGIAPPGSAVPRSIVAMWTSNGDPPGAPPPPPDPDWPQKRPHNIWRVDAEPWTAPVNDPFYDHREWDPMGAGATVVAPQPAETAANAFHVEPFTVFDVLDPTSSWLYWHARRLNGLTGEWDSSVGVASDSIAPYLYDTGARVRGLRALVLQDPANRPPAQPVAWHWLFWHSGEEGQQRIGFNPCFDPDAPRVSVREELLRLTNARLGSAEPRVIEYRNYTGADALTGVEADTGADPLAAFQAAFDPDGDAVTDPLVRKPASNPFTFTKDPWVVEYAYQPANPLTSRLHVFYSAGLRHQRNSDICWSMFDAFAGGQGLMTDPAANYGKIAFRRLDASNGRRLLPFSSVPALRNHPWMRLGERLANDGGWQTFTSRHPDWVISRYYPMPLDPVDQDYWNGLSADRDGDGAPELLNTRWSGIIDRDPATLAVDPDRNPYDVDPVIYVVLIVDSLYDPADDVYRRASVHVARQIDWDPTDPAAGLSMVELDPNAATPVYPMPLMWDPRDRKGNYYDERTGLVHITPLNLSPDPALSAAEPVPVTMTIDPSAGVVKFSRPLFNEHDPGDPRAVFHAAAADNLAMGDIMGLVGVHVWLDYQPFTYRITTDGNADESPAAVFDDFRRLAVFWQRRQSGVGDPDKGAPSFMYKTYNTAVQVLRPPITADPTSVEARDTFGNWLAVHPPGGWPGSPSDPCWLHAGVGASGIIHFDGGNLDAATRVDVDGDGTREQPQVSLPAEMRVTYDDTDGIQRTERHCVVGWSQEMRAPTAAVVSEGPVTVTPETYTVNTDGEPVDVVKYWLFWTSTRGLYAPGAPPPPAVGFLGDVPASDVYYGVMAPTFGSAVPE